jgi:ATP/maltotriose-dependent transcriptional regulator MalT
LAEALAQAGNWSEAALLAERVLGQLDASGQGFFRPDYLRLRGDCLVGLYGAAEAQTQAEALYRDAVQVSDFQGSVVHRLRAALSLARLLRQTGRADEGRRLMSESLALLPEKGSLPEMSEALALSATP